jgi:hypothetical protein
MERSYRIKANVGKDQVLNINLKQDVDLYELLSLTLKQENFYKLHSADYGVIVGRVLANDAFGVPNVKVSVFIPLSNADKTRMDIRSIYPYNSTTDRDSAGVRFNTLPNYKKFDCHQEVGSFPKKRLVLDNDSVLEIYDKYYRYTTVTNKSGDYMIFGVPTGEQTIHIDVDLSDIGLLSQTPRDMIYKGYSPDLFESPTMFKKSTNLDSLPQIQSQTTSVTVYPLWGDKSSNEIAISRKDISLQYKFEPTCIFIGSVVTDNSSNSIGHNCIPDEGVGEAKQLSPNKGSIEMIRKTVDDSIEEYTVKGNQLIDGDGVWCYQIPMNLDYIGMDEYGNISPISNSDKGIPTRARVRFRISLDETDGDSLTKHTAKYLVPNNPELYHGFESVRIHKDKIDNDSFYEFGSLTPNECFRDLYWDKVYSVKNYIPRLQVSNHENTTNYLAIKGVNKSDANKYNPLPFNKLNLNVSLSAYYLLRTIGGGSFFVSSFWRYLRGKSVPYNTDAMREKILEEMDGIGLDFYNDWLNGCLYFPRWYWQIKQKEKGIKKNESTYYSTFCECNGENQEHQLFLYNNCSLVYENDDMVLTGSSKISALEDRKEVIDKLRNFYRFYYVEEKHYDFDAYTSIALGSKNFVSGVIKKKITKNNEEVFYYTFGNKLTNELYYGDSNYNNLVKQYPIDDDIITNGRDYYFYARLFSTDIILLGSLKDDDIDGIPKIGFNIPSTTSNIPPMGRYKRDETDSEDYEDGSDYNRTLEYAPQYYKGDDLEETVITNNGMNWGAFWEKQSDTNYPWPRKQTTYDGYKYYLGSGLFFGLGFRQIPLKISYYISGLFSMLPMWMFRGTYRAIVPVSDIKTCVNAERISELGVSFDSNVKMNNDGTYYETTMDGLITRHEIFNTDARALFATLNSNKLNGLIENEFTGYKKYYLTYLYPTSFDGRLENLSRAYTSGYTTDDRNKDYLDFRFGSNSQSIITSRRPFGLNYNKRNSVIYSTNDNNVIENGNNSYVIHDGYIEVSKQIIPRKRHFYGFENFYTQQTGWNIDNVYPFNNPEDSIRTQIYAFPLYENSFYFYFGLNQGSTAIDKFYNNFYSECEVENKDPFLVSITSTASDVCSYSSAKMSINVQNIDYPYTVYVTCANIQYAVKRIRRVDTTTIENIPNEKYAITIVDPKGVSMTTEHTIKYDKIELFFNSTDIAIDTSPASATCQSITTSNCGTISLESYVVDNEKNAINTITPVSTQDGIYKVGDNVNIRIYPRYNPDDSFSNYYKGINGNTFSICKTGIFSIEIYQLCGDEKSDNVSYYVVEVSDTKKHEEKKEENTTN